MTFISSDSQSRALHLSMMIFVSAYVELEDALHWTHELLVRLDTGPIGFPSELQCVTDRSIAIRSLLQLVAADKRPPQTVIDDILRECLATQALYEKIIANPANADESMERAKLSGHSSSQKIRRHAGRMLGLAARVLGLHALYYSSGRHGNSSGGVGEDECGENAGLRHAAA